MLIAFLTQIQYVYFEAFQSDLEYIHTKTEKQQLALVIQHGMTVLILYARHGCSSPFKS